MKVTIFKNITETKNPFYLSIPEIVERIKNGKSKGLVSKIRGSKTKEDRHEYKKQLPSICFSGIFETRANKAIKEHSGLVCLDFDHVDNVEEFKNHFKEDAHTMLAFISPSGDGLKVIIKIPASIENHAFSCKALKDYFKSEKLDNFEDVARVCYESFDENIYYNPDSTVFTDLIKEEIKEVKVTTQSSNKETFDKLKTWIEKFEYYSDGNKHKFLVKFAGALNRYGINENEAANLLINNYQSAATYVKSEHIEKIVQKVYQGYKHQFNISFFEKNGTSIERTTGKRTGEDFFKEYEQKEDKKAQLKKLLSATFIDTDVDIKEPPTILAIRDGQTHNRILTLGNISTIKGAQKSKKSYFASMIAASLTADEEIFNNLIPSMQNDKKQVLLFDTEQSEYDSLNVSRRIKKMAAYGSLNTNTDHFGSFSFRGLDGKQIIDLIEYAVNEIYKNVGIIFIDQLADTVSSLNNEEEAVNVVRLLEKMTKENSMHVCNIVHVNKHDGFAQGWLGTQLMKKSETIIDIKRDEQYKHISHISGADTRGAGFSDFSIKINQYGYPEILSKLESNEIIDI